MSDAATILVVEDDQAIRLLLQETLAEHGYTTVQAADGPAALAAAEACDPDLVLLDVALPGVDGFGVLAELKAAESARNVPVLMVTAWGDAALVRRALDHGAHGAVRKPFEVHELIAAVEAALEPTVASDALDVRIDDGAPFTAMLADVDDVERVEDLYGPVAAAALMAAVGRRLRAAAPDARVLTRLGRRELLVIAPGDAADLADELGPIVSSHPVDLGSVVIRASISLGYAAWEGESAGELLGRCAEALEAARDAGGDCAEAAEPAADALPAAA